MHAVVTGPDDSYYCDVTTFYSPGLQSLGWLRRASSPAAGHLASQRRKFCTVSAGAARRGGLFTQQIRVRTRALHSKCDCLRVSRPLLWGGCRLYPWTVLDSYE